MEVELLDSLAADARAVEASFGVGGSLGAQRVTLAARPSPGARQAVAVDLPGATVGDLEALQAVCAPATFGLGSKEVLDPTYRRALALPADRFLTSFDLAQHAGVLRAVRSLLLPDAAYVTSELHALNIYTVGGFFMAPRDTPRGSPLFVAPWWSACQRRMREAACAWRTAGARQCTSRARARRQARCSGRHFTVTRSTRCSL